MLVGLSLSFCVKDILDGKVAIEDVAFINAGTKARTKEHWAEILAVYKKAYWYDNPEGERIALHFIERGLVIQPRLEGKVLAHGRLTWVDQQMFNEFAKEHTIND